MKIIIAGGRDITDVNELEQAIRESGFGISEVVSGSVRGADALGQDWAETNGIPVTLFPADWAQYGRGAGPIRNRQMGDYAEALIALWDGRSRGTESMIEYARSKGLKVYVHYVK